MANAPTKDKTEGGENKIKEAEEKIMDYSGTCSSSYDVNELKKVVYKKKTYFLHRKTRQKTNNGICYHGIACLYRMKQQYNIAP